MICPDTMITTAWPSEGVMTAADDGIRLFYDVGGAVMVQPLDAAGRFVGEPQRLDGAPSFRNVTIAGDLYVFEDKDQLTAFTRDGRHAWSTAIEHPDTVILPWAVVAYGGDELGVVWEQNEPDGRPGDEARVTVWFMRMDLDGRPTSERVMLPGEDLEHAAVLGGYPAAEALRAVNGDYVVVWDKIGYADPDRDHELMQTRIGGELVTTPLAKQQGITLVTSTAVGGELEVAAWDKYADISGPTTSAWIRYQGQSTVISLAEPSSRPSVAIDGERIVAVWDGGTVGRREPMVIATLDPSSGAIVSRKPLGFDRPEGSWQTNRGLFVTECGVVVPFVDVVDSKAPVWSTIYVPR